MSERRTALVTGSSRGIGKAISEQLIEDGHFVIGTATSSKGIEAVTTTVGTNGIGLELRLDNRDSIDRFLSTLNEEKLTVDILVNNAGVTQDNLVLRMSDEIWQQVIETNLTGTFRITKPLLRNMMRKRWGRIVNLGSVVGAMGNPGQSNYVASKAGIEGFTRSLALEIGSRGITVNCVAPGFVDTDMTANLSEAVVETFLSRVPLGRLGTVQDIAGVVGFLTSDAASYITAQTIHVNGGLLAH